MLTGQYDNGLGQKMNAGPRGLRSLPYQSMAIWIPTQMSWGYIKGDVDYQKVARRCSPPTSAGRS